MPRTSRSRRGKKDAAAANEAEAEDDNPSNSNNQRQLPEHVRNRQRAVAEREAARLARPERRAQATLGHADRKKSAVTSTPFGILASRSTTTAAAGSQDTTWCGPFTVARQMLAARDQALVGDQITGEVAIKPLLRFLQVTLGQGMADQAIAQTDRSQQRPQDQGQFALPFRSGGGSWRGATHRREPAPSPAVFLYGCTLLF